MESTNTNPSHATSTSHRYIPSRFGSGSLQSVAISAVNTLPTPFGVFLSVVASTFLPNTTQSDLSNVRSDGNKMSGDNVMGVSAFVGPGVLGNVGGNIQSTTAPGSTQMQLSTSCLTCGDRVAVDVPAWMTDAMSASQQVGRGWDEGAGSHSHTFENDGGRRNQREWREGIVGGAIKLAIAIKSSSIPPLFAAAFRSLITFILYLDRIFSLHQRLAIMAAIILEGLVEIEREVGLFRSVGEGMSVAWEAFIKGTIAMAKSDSNPEPTRHQHQQSHHGSNSGTSTPYYTSLRPPSPPQSSMSNLQNFNNQYYPDGLNPQPHHQQYQNQYDPPTSGTSSSKRNHTQSSAGASTLPEDVRHRLRRGATPSLPLLLASSASSAFLSTVPFPSMGPTQPTSSKSHLAPPSFAPPPHYSTLAGRNTRASTPPIVTSVSFSPEVTGGMGEGIKRRRTRSEDLKILDGGEFESEKSVKGNVGSVGLEMGRGYAGRVAGAVGRQLGLGR